VPRGGGAVRTLCEAAASRGGSWSPKGTIVFSESYGVQGLSRVPDQGGTPVHVTKPMRHDQRYPQFLPDGDRFLFLLLAGKTDVAGVYVASLSGAAPVRVLEGNTRAAFVPAPAAGGDGYLLFRKPEGLMAMVFDTTRTRTVGAPFLVATDVSGGANTGFGAFSVSPDGTLAYARDTSVSQELVWLDRSGKRLSVVASDVNLSDVGLAPDERRVAVSLATGASEPDVWILEPGRSPSRFTFGPSPGWGSPVWSPKGDQIAYATVGLGGFPGYDIRRKASSGAAQDETLFTSTGTVSVWGWAPDGKSLLVSVGLDLLLLPIEGDRRPVQFMRPADGRVGQFSPDGRWIAYVAGNEGQGDVYVQPVPATGSKWQVSKGGGLVPRWKGDGHELYYRANDGQLMAVAVSEGPGGSIQLGSTQQALFPIPSTGNTDSYLYAPAGDGQRFLVALPLAGTEAPLTVVQNWTAAVKR